MRSLVNLIIVGTVFIGSSVATPSLAEETAESSTVARLAVENLPAEFILGDPSNPENLLEVKVVLESKVAGELRVEFVDFIDRNPLNTLPGGLLPFSLANALTIEPFETRHDPDSKSNVRIIRVLAKDPNEVDPRIYFGGLRVSFIPDPSQASIKSNKASLVNPLTAVPFGVMDYLEDEQALPVQITKHEIQPLVRSSFIDEVIPDIPGIVNFGPVRSVLTLASFGTVPVFSSVDWEFQHAGETLARSEVAKRMFLPSRSSEVEALSVLRNPVSGTDLNLLPAFGFVDIHASVASSLGGSEFPLEKSSSRILIIQWKEPAAFFAGILFLMFLLLKVRSRFKREKPAA